MHNLLSPNKANKNNKKKTPLPENQQYQNAETLVKTEKYSLQES